jgi:hypothetical protein
MCCFLLIEKEKRRRNGRGGKGACYCYKFNITNEFPNKISNSKLSSVIPSKILIC